MADAPTEGNMLTRKLGPLPVIAWGGIVAAVYVAYKWATVGRSTAKTEAQTVTEPDYDINNDPGYGNAADPYNGGSTANTPKTDSVPADNMTWAKRAINWLIANGIDPETANTAINTYVNQTGQMLNTSQLAAWKLALQQFGNPPEGSLPTPAGNTGPDVSNPQPGTPNTPPVIDDPRKPYTDIFGYDPRRPGTTQPDRNNGPMIDPNDPHWATVLNVNGL